MIIAFERLYLHSNAFRKSKYHRLKEEYQYKKDMTI